MAAALEQLRDDADVQLFAAYVDTTGGEEVNAFTEGTAVASSLGGNDALILVAIEDRSYSMWVGPSLDEITDDEIDAILTEALEPALVDGEFAAAMVSAADAIGSGGPDRYGRDASTRDARRAGADRGLGLRLWLGLGISGGGLDLTPILAILLVAGGLFLVGRALLQRRASAKAQAAALDTLNRDANRALLGADEALKDAANDVEFAAAQWGDPEVVPYREAIRHANDELRAAFALRQKLDDAYPEKPPERDAMLREIIARCTRAQELLDAQEQRFDELRDLEASAPAQLAALPAAIEALRARRAAADQAADPPARGVRRHPRPPRSTATSRRPARPSMRRPARPRAGPRSSAPSHPRAWSRCAGRRRRWPARRSWWRRSSGSPPAWTTPLRGCPAELDAAAADVAAARDAVARLARCPRCRPRRPAAAAAADPGAALRAAEAALGEARRAAEARPLDPLAALQRAVAANQAADAIVAQVARCQRRSSPDAGRSPRRPIATAQGHVSRAIDYITTRRHGVGEAARTRAAEAEIRLERGPGARRRPTRRARPRRPTAPPARRRGVPAGRGRVRGLEPRAAARWPARTGPAAADDRGHRRGARRHPRRRDHRARASAARPRQRLGWQPVGRRRRRIRAAASACRRAAAGADDRAAAGSACRRAVAGGGGRRPRPRRALVGGARSWRARRINRQGRESIDLDAIGRTPWRRPRSSGASASSSARTSTRCSTRPRTRRRCWTS